MNTKPASIWNATVLPVRLPPTPLPATPPKTRVAVFGSFMGGYHVLRELLTRELAERLQIAGVATDDPTQPFTRPNVGERGLHTYSLSAVCALLQEIWFLTTRGMTPSGPGFDPPLIGNGRRALRFRACREEQLGTGLQDGAYGLAAFHRWIGNGVDDVWCSTEKGFESTQGPISAGERISSKGYGVFRNLDLVSNFAPIEDLADFGLDALFVITEAQPGALAPQLTEPASLPAGVMLPWDSLGRAFQVEGASDVRGPYLPLSPIIPDLEWSDTNASATRANAFYRVRMW